MVPLVILKNDYKNILQEVINLLENEGLRIITSFDSQTTRRDKTSVFCPHHGTAVCNYHIIIMLVYETDGYPATLIVYGQDDEYWISLTFPPGLRPSASLQNQINTALKQSHLYVSSNLSL